MSQQLVTDWWTKVPVTPIVPRRNCVVLPIFNIVNPAWKGASEIVQQYNFSASSNFYLTGRPAKPSGVNYGLCIRYRSNGVVYRYKLWEDDLFVLNNVELYNKHLIKKNFVLEIWTFNGAANSSQATAINLWSSVRTVPSDFTVDTSIPLAYSALATYADLQSTSAIAKSPVAGMLTWLNSEYGVTYDGTGKVSLWEDMDANRGFDLDVPGGVDQPNYIANGAGDQNLPYLYASTTDAKLFSTKTALIHHWFAVAAQVTYTSGNVMISGLPGTASFRQLGASPVVSVNGSTVRTDLTLMTLTNWFIISSANTALAGGKVTQRVSKVHDFVNTVETVTDGGADLYAASVLRFGHSSANTADFGIAEFIGYPAALSAADEATVIAYLVEKYKTGRPAFGGLTFNANSSWLDNP